MAERNVAMTVEFLVWDTNANTPKTGDSANITLRWVKDGTSAALTSGTVTEIDATNCPGLYKCDLSSSETNCKVGMLHGKSSTANTYIMPVEFGFVYTPSSSFTVPTNFSSLAITGGGAVTAGTVSDKSGYTIATGGIGSGDIDSTALNEIADAVLDRVLSAGSDSGGDNTTARTVRQALRTLRNRVNNSAGTLTVYKEDDTTASWTAATTQTAGDPISQINPT